MSLDYFSKQLLHTLSCLLSQLGYVTKQRLTYLIEQWAYQDGELSNQFVGLIC